MVALTLSTLKMLFFPDAANNWKVESLEKITLHQSSAVHSLYLLKNINLFLMLSVYFFPLVKCFMFLPCLASDLHPNIFAFHADALTPACFHYWASSALVVAWSRSLGLLFSQQNNKQNKNPSTKMVLKYLPKVIYPNNQGTVWPEA